MGSETSIPLTRFSAIYWQALHQNRVKCIFFTSDIARLNECFCWATIVAWSAALLSVKVSDENICFALEIWNMQLKKVHHDTILLNIQQWNLLKPQKMIYYFCSPIFQNLHNNSGRSSVMRLIALYSYPTHAAIFSQTCGARFPWKERAPLSCRQWRRN
jgi:hypothetical protein